MPDKTTPKKNFPYIQIRIEPNHKEKWINFKKEHSEIRNLTHLITASVENFIETYDNPKTSRKEDSKEILQYLMEENKRKEEQLLEALSQLKEIQIALANKSKIETNGSIDLKMRVFEMIADGSFNTTQIAKVMNIDEGIIMNIVNLLVKEASIEHDPTYKKQMKWRVKK